jgi:ABC-type molybdenum transport system ATPase subunit/photorepair protein PhrA
VFPAELQMRYQKRIPAYDVICSGFFDSMGLYQSCTEEQHQNERVSESRYGHAFLCVRPSGFQEIIHSLSNSPCHHLP